MSHFFAQINFKLISVETKLNSISLSDICSDIWKKNIHTRTVRSTRALKNLIHHWSCGLPPSPVLNSSHCEPQAYTRVGVKESCNCSFKILSHCTAQRGSQQKIFRGRQNINFLFKHLPIHFRQFCSKTQARYFENGLVVTVGPIVWGLDITSNPHPSTSMISMAAVVKKRCVLISVMN